MLQIQNICKQYKTGDLVQDALKDVSVNLRDSEFVAILGPSGSGKTTLLNIIGGLDRYDSGNLIINNIATNKYKDRDWDSYRNHTIGFVFQSYYLIPHQTVLSNVELALTLSGISKEERRERALEALDKVGLKDQAHKKPTQMSGGQMQRVAIARALINNPSILLADEPTGALDTKTSIQVMDLLKEVAKDRLVVMVTHNPELAQEYASRIIKLKDGVITDDSDPYTPEMSEKEEEVPVHKNMGKSAMSFGTSLQLSFNNLRTKKGRTFLTAFAGSIGIIGIAMILSISTGVDNYINDIQKDTMTAYPLTIQDETTDLSSYISSMKSTAQDNAEVVDENRKLDRIYSNSARLEMASNANSSQVVNNLKPFKEYLDDENSEIHKYLGENGIVYSYDVKFDVYAIDPNGNGVNTNVYKDGQTIEHGGSSYAMQMDNNMNFAEIIPGSGDNLISAPILDNYEVVSGKWPENYNEVVIVLNANNELELTTIYELGFLPYSEYEQMTKEFVEGDIIEFENVEMSYDEVIGHKFYLMTESDYYVLGDDGNYQYKYEAGYNINANLDKATELTVCGIVRKTGDDASIGASVGYTNELTKYLVDHTNNSGVVLAQKANPDTNVLTGVTFDPSSEDERIDAVDAYIHSASANELTSILMAYMNRIPDSVKEQYGDMMSGSMGGTDMSGQDVTAEDMVKIFDQVIPYISMLGIDGISSSSDFYNDFYNNYIANGSYSGSYDQNMDSFGVVDLDSPSSIAIYTDSFENKDEVTRCISEYNESCKNEEDQIVYTDYIGLLLSSVTTIVNVISYVLIAFVSVSLIVSSIMIGIITFISVLERTKEIGILRAIGASKKNISQVFNAETFIIGLLSGIIGIGVTELLLIPINIIIHAIASNNNVNAVLGIVPAIILIVLSTILTLIGGIIPSKKAAKMDPVAALRTE